MKSNSDDVRDAFPLLPTILPLQLITHLLLYSDITTISIMGTQILGILILLSKHTMPQLRPLDLTIIHFMLEKHPLPDLQLLSKLKEDIQPVIIIIMHRKRIIMMITIEEHHIMRDRALIRMIHTGDTKGKLETKERFQSP
jgi:hypothetical protein